VSLAHGTNDAQKTMGVITLALIADGTLAKGAQAPFWVILSCALAISIGTYLGGWRVIRTLGKGLVEIESPPGPACPRCSPSGCAHWPRRAAGCRPRAPIQITCTAVTCWAWSSPRSAS
jgi:hypothetical protein